MTPKNRIQHLCLDDYETDVCLRLCGEAQKDLFDRGLNRDDQGYGYLAGQVLQDFQKVSPEWRLDPLHFRLVREVIWLMDHSRS